MFSKFTMDKFKKLENITFEITNKIFKKYDYKFIKISENWKNIVGSHYYNLSSPKKISKDMSLTVLVNSTIIMDFEYACPKILKKIEAILGKDAISKIKILQTYS